MNAWIRSDALAHSEAQELTNGEPCEILARTGTVALVRTESGLRRVVFWSELLRYPEREAQGEW